MSKNELDSKAQTDGNIKCAYQQSSIIKLANNDTIKKESNRVLSKSNDCLVTDLEEEEQSSSSMTTNLKKPTKTKVLFDLHTDVNKTSDDNNPVVPPTAPLVNGGSNALGNS